MVTSASLTSAEMLISKVSSVFRGSYRPWRGFGTSTSVLHQDQANSSGDQANKQTKTPTPKAKTPIGKLDELEEGQHPFREKEPLPPWPDNTNPHTGEVGGPRGPEPTRYGDWERKGRVTDF